MTGGDNNLAVIVAAFSPGHVSCNSDLPQPGIEASCQSILAQIPYDAQNTWFGSGGYGNVTLLRTYTSRK